MSGKAFAADREADLVAARARLYALCPAAADFDRMRLVPRPYVMRLAEPNYRSPTLATDEHGFRVLVRNRERLGYREFCALTGRKAIILGTSIGFGYGLSGDERALQARLTACGAGDAAWYNLSLPMANIMQMRIAFELFASRDARLCVISCGVIGLALALLSQQADSAAFPSVDLGADLTAET